jgi:hypothetical protein
MDPAYGAPQKTWGDWCTQQFEQAGEVVGKFVEDNFTNLSFAVSSIFTALYAAPSFFTGAAVGAALHHYLQPNLKVDATQEKVVTVFHATFAIVAAVATFVTMMGSATLISSTIPFLFSMGAGSAGYRAYTALCK